jgi:inhibitor of KinA
LSPYEWVREQLVRAHEEAGRHAATRKGMVHRIPICYEEMFSLDMDFLCESNHIDRAEVIRLHTERTYTIYMIGFLPGFPYLAEVDARIAVPRKSRPRSRVPAGSVGIAGVQTGIYPVDSPGGWQIIGRTPVKMFDPRANPPVPFEAGDSISFYSITREAFEKFTP